MMEIKISMETITKMINLCENHKKGVLNKHELEELLDHEDYKVELDRYNNAGGPRGGFTKEEYVDFFINFFKLNVNDIKNERLRMRYNDLKFFFDNLDFYKEQIKKLNSLNDSVIEECLKYTLYGLPDDIKLDKLHLIFSLGLGNSGGWFYKHYSHYDIVQFLKDFDLKIVKSTIAHESHHIGFSLYLSNLDLSKLTVEEHLYLFLAGEGLAVKYCNNGQGVLTKKIYDSEPNIGIDKATWEYLNDNFEETYKHFKEQVYKVRNGEINDMDKLDKYISEYWFSLHIDSQDKFEIPKLKHSRNYSFGNDLWGLIHDIYGKDMVFKILTDLKQFPEVLNNAFEKINRGDLKY